MNSTILKIVNDSIILKEYLEDDILNGNMQNIYDFINTLKYPIDDVVSLYEGDYNLGGNKLVKLIINLDYLQCYEKLNECIILLKFSKGIINITKFSNNLQRYISEYHVKDNLFDTLLFYGRLEALIWVERKNRQMKFDKSCATGKLEIAKWMYSRGDIIITPDNFREVIKNGFLNVLIWFLSLDNSESLVVNSFMNACANHKIEIVTYLFLKYTLSPEIIHTAHFLNVVASGSDYTVLKFLYEKFGMNMNTLLELFINCFKNGSLNIAIWIYSLIGVIDSTILRDCFLKSCMNNHLEMAKWLYYTFNILNPSDEVMQHICSKGSMEFYNWALSVGYNVINDATFLFYIACSNGHLEISQCIYNSNINNGTPIDINADNDVTFRIVCENGHLELAQYLLSLPGHIDIHSNEDEAFISACGNGHLDIAQLIYQMGGTNIHNQEESAFILAAQNDYYDILEYLLSLQSIEGNIDIYAQDNELDISELSHRVKELLLDIHTDRELYEMDFSDL